MGAVCSKWLVDQGCEKWPSDGHAPVGAQQVGTTIAPATPSKVSKRKKCVPPKPGWLGGGFWFHSERSLVGTNFAHFNVRESEKLQETVGALVLERHTMSPCL